MDIMKTIYLVIILLFLTSCVSVSQYRKTYDNSNKEYSGFMAPGCLDANQPMLNMKSWNIIDFIGPKVFVYLKNGSIFDYKSDCIYVMKKSSEPDIIKSVIPKKDMI